MSGCLDTGKKEIFDEDEFIYFEVMEENYKSVSDFYMRMVDGKQISINKQRLRILFLRNILK